MLTRRGGSSPPPPPFVLHCFSCTLRWFFRVWFPHRASRTPNSPPPPLAQAILSRSNKFDASLFPILTVEDLVAQVKPAKLWLNIQHDIFYRQLNLDMRSGYVESYTSVVMDAHREGLEVFASEFANDVLFSYNYSYDPLAEVLSFIDNGIFSVDGGCDRLPHNRIRGHRSNSGDKYVWMVSSLSTLGQLQHIEIEAGKTEIENKDVIDCWMLEKMNSVEKLNEINAMYEDMMQQLKVSSVKQLAQQQADGIINQREAGYVDHVKSTVQSSCKHTIRAHEGGCGSILFQLNSDKLISGCQDRTVKIWDTKSGTLSSTLHDCLGSVLDLAITHDNRSIIAASSSNNLYVWETSSGQVQHTLTGHTDKACAVDASKVSSHNSVSAAYDHTMKVWDLMKGYCTNTIIFQSNCNLLSYSMDGLTFHSGHVDEVASEVAARSQAVTSIYISQSESLLLTSGRDNLHSLVDLRTLEICGTFRANGNRVASNWSITVGSADGSIYIWSRLNNDMLSILEGHSSPVLSFAYSGPGNTLAYADKNGN
ncbi:glycerophosphoryl diester phosphodiesterase, partial [Musa troglodytarum]